jgi:hypothetical protein
VFEVEIFLNDLDPNAVRVELYADGINGGDPVREEMKWARLAGAPAAASTTRRLHVRDYTARPAQRLHGASDTAPAVSTSALRSRWKSARILTLATMRSKNI